LPIDDEGDLLTELIGFIHQVSDGDTFLAELFDGQAYVASRDGVQAPAGLVEKEYWWAVKQGTSNHQALSHTVGEGADVIFGAVTQLDQIKDLVRPALRQSIKPARKCKIVARREAFIEILLFKNDANAFF